MRKIEIEKQVVPRAMFFDWNEMLNQHTNHWYTKGRELGYDEGFEAGKKYYLKNKEHGTT